MKHETKNKNNRRKQQTTKMKAPWVSKMGCWESLFERNKQTLRKEKARKRKIKKPNILMFSKKRVDGQKAKKTNGVLKGKTKGKPEKKTEKEEIRIKKQAFFGTQKRKKTLKMQEILNSLFWFFQTKNNDIKKKQNHQTTKKQTKKHLFACWQTPPPSLVNFCFFSSCTLLVLQSCVSLKTL